MSHDPISPEVTIRLDRERRLRFTFGAARRFKKETGQSMFSAAAWQSIDEDLIPVLIWCLLVNEDRDITVDEVAEHLDFGSFDVITGALNKLYSTSVTQTEGEEERPTPASPSQN